MYASQYAKISALNKFIQRNESQNAIDIAFQFKKTLYLKKTLINICIENCPDFLLIYNIFKTHIHEKENIIKWIPLICEHVKTRDGIYGARIACEHEENTNPIDIKKDDLITLLEKCLYHIRTNKINEFISEFEIYNINLLALYYFSDFNKAFLYSLCVWSKYDFIREHPYEYYIQQYKTITVENKNADIEIPSFAYDRTVFESPQQQKTYEFLENNTILIPRNTVTEIEIEGKKLFTTTNKGINDYITPSIKCSTLTSFNAIHLYYNENKNNKILFISLKDENYKFIIKGPYIDLNKIERQILSDRLKKVLFPNIKYSSQLVFINRHLYYMTHNHISIDPSLTKDEKTTKIPVYTGKLYQLRNYMIREMNDDEITSLFTILAYRKIIGVNITSYNSILYFNNILYSINDPISMKNKKYIFSFERTKLEVKLLEKRLQKVFKNIVSILKQWCKTIIDIEFLPFNVKIYIIHNIYTYTNIKNWKF